MTLTPDVPQEVRLPLWCRHFYFKTKNRRQPVVVCCQCLWCHSFVTLTSGLFCRMSAQVIQAATKWVWGAGAGGWISPGVGVWVQHETKSHWLLLQQLKQIFSGHFVWPHRDYRHARFESQYSVVLEIWMNKWENILCAVHAGIQQSFSRTTVRSFWHIYHYTPAQISHLAPVSLFFFFFCHISFISSSETQEIRERYAIKLATGCVACGRRLHN